LNNIMKNRKLLAIIFIAIVVLAAIVAAIYSFAILKAVKIVPNDGVTITLISLKNSKEVASLTQAKTIRVQAGDYSVSYKAGAEYQEESENISIKSSTTITSPQLNYTSAKLAEMLTAEQPTIQAVTATIGGVGDYQITEETLYVRGEWYGAVLGPTTWYGPVDETGVQPPNPSNTLDIVKVIAQKTDGQWQIVAGPSLVLSIADNPSIPEEVIRAVNRLGLH
jgi:hypothetical protein